MYKQYSKVYKKSLNKKASEDDHGWSKTLFTNKNIIFFLKKYK